jgi:hypothetical protein
MDVESLIWETDMAQLLQLFHVESCLRGAQLTWSHYFEPEPDLIARFEELANGDLPEIC